MSTDADLKARFETDLAGFVCASTAANHIAKLLFLVLNGTEELERVPAHLRAERINRLAIDLAREGAER